MNLMSHSGYDAMPVYGDPFRPLEAFLAILRVAVESSDSGPPGNSHD